MPLTLSPEELKYVSTLLAESQASRYLSGLLALFFVTLSGIDLSCSPAVGLVALLYDHLLTLPEEVSLIWKAPPSYAKYGFLLNRYMVPGELISIAFGEYSSSSCIPSHIVPVPRDVRVYGYSYCGYRTCF